jgi:hypothetical protein
MFLLAAGTYVWKSAGPLFLGSRPLRPELQRFVDLLPAALLAALAVVSTLADGQTIVINAQVAGMLVAALALWRKAPFVVVVVLASVTTALVRLIS